MPKYHACTLLGKKKRNQFVLALVLSSTSIMPVPTSDSRKHWREIPTVWDSKGRAVGAGTPAPEASGGMTPNV